MTLAVNLQRLRREQRYSQADLAEAAGGDVSAAWVGQVERGEIKHPAHHRLAAIAKVFGISVDQLVEGDALLPELGGVRAEPIEDALIIRYRTAKRTKLTARERESVEKTLRELIETILRSREDSDEGTGQRGNATG